ncbi:MAG: O-antigen ligase family protein [Candidatus Moraniibacteriota bacterium]|nr:MAG: O-antigen ligase family protein [Candidatus Moranbacteria bacterium]
MIFLAVSSVLFISLLILNYPVSQSSIVSLFSLLPFFLFAFPFITLGFLLIVRPSLDYLSDTFYFFLPFGEGMTVTLAQGFGLGVVFLSLLFFLRFRKAFLSHTLSSFFLLLLSWGAFTLSYTIDTTQTMYELFRLLSIFFVFSFSYYLIVNEKSFIKLLIIILVSCVIPVFTAWTQFVLGIGYTDDAFSVPRIYGTFAHPNIFALYLTIAIAAGSLLFLFIRKPLYKMFLGSTLFILLITLFFTYSRAAWGTFFLFAILVIFYKYPKSLPFIIIFPLIVFFISSPVRDRVEDVLHFSQSSSLTWRINIWTDTISKTQEEGKILLGYGLNTFEEVAESLRGIRFVVNDPHSEFVRSFVEGGIIGLLVFLIFSLAPLIISWKQFHITSKEKLTSQDSRKKTVFFILWALLLSLFFLSFTDHVLRSTMVQWSLWALLGGALRVYVKPPSSLNE